MSRIGSPQFLVKEGYADRYDYALQAMQEIPYNHWRDYDPEDTVRFHALRLHEVGMIKSSPQKIIAQSSDWRFLEELKREPKSQGYGLGSRRLGRGRER